MRLTALAISRYGNFADQRITFSPDPGVINLLMLPNGGGKSVMRTAFCDLLFGIGGQSPMGFRYPYNQMKIHAEAVADGTHFAFARRKRNTQTLVDADDKPLDASVVNRFLGGVDRRRLERLFALDTERLREGERDLLASNGALGAALISGAGGTRNLRDLRKALADRRDQLAPLRRTASRPFYAAADRYIEARKNKDRSLLRPKEWQRREEAREAASAQQAEANREAAAASAQLARLERIRRVRPLLAQRAVAAAWLSANPDAPALDPALKERFGKAHEALVRAELAHANAQQEAGRAAQALEGTGVDDAMLAKSEAVKRLTDEAGAARKAQADLPGVEAQLRASEDRIAEGLRELGAAVAIDRVAELIPSKATRDKVSRLIKAHAAQRKLELSVPQEIEAKTRERDGIETELGRLPAASDLSALQALAKDIRTDGDPAREMRTGRQARDNAEVDLAGALALVPGWAGDAEALAALRPLPADAYERAADSVSHAETLVTERREALDAVRDDEAAAQENLDRLIGGAPLPDAARLAAVRERRDQGWRLIYRRAFTADPPGAAEEAGFAGPLPLPIAYERVVTEADNMADRRVDQADRIAQAAAARAVLHQLGGRREAAVQALRTQEEKLGAARREWQQLCSVMPLGEAPSLQEVRQFLKRREDAVAARSALALAEAALSALSDTYAAWALRLAEMLGEKCLPSNGPAAALPGLLAQADQRLEAADKADKERANLEGRLQAAVKALDEAQVQQRAAEKERDNWQQQWTHAMRALSRPADDDPDIAEANLRVLAELDQALKERADRLVRVEGMQSDLLRFTQESKAIAARAAPDLDVDDPFFAAAALQQRLDEARQAATLREERREQAGTAADALDKADRALRDRRADLAAVMTLIGGHTPDAAEARLRLAEERAGHAETLRTCEAQLLSQGDSLPLEVLREEAASVAPDALPGEIEQVRTRQDAAQRNAQDAAALAARLTQEMKEKESATDVNDAAAAQQAAVATLDRVLEEALVQHVAAGLLEEAIKTVENTEAPKVLTKISELFRHLTDGVYSRVQTELADDNQPRLVLIQRDWPDEQQSVTELSEGTRDQLYLALRLAAIEEQARISQPPPFIGDDILQTFDDARAVAAMRVLCEVSEKVQVILMTHHRHVLELAQELPDGAVHVCALADRLAA